MGYIYFCQRKGAWVVQWKMSLGYAVVEWCSGQAVEEAGRRSLHVSSLNECLLQGIWVMQQTGIWIIAGQGAVTMRWTGYLVWLADRALSLSGMVCTHTLQLV